MERIEGQKINQAMESGMDMQPIAHHFLSAAYQMLYVDGFFHGDAHPGNLFILPDHRIALIDFGMVGRLSQEMREQVVDIVFAIMNQDLRAVARAFYQLGSPETPIDYTQYESECIQVLEEEVMGKPLSEIDIGSLFMKICEGAIKYRIRMPADFTMMFKAMVSAEGLAKILAPDINVIEEARPYIVQLMAERYSFKRISEEALRDFKQLAQFARNVPGVGGEVLKQLHQGQLKINFHSKDIQDWNKQQVRLFFRKERLFFSIACLVCGTLTLQHAGETFLLFRTSVWFFYALALLAGISLLKAWLWGD